jgi:hypothetical protein
MQFYPEETKGPVSEVWQAARWKEFKPSELTPMYARGWRHFYIDEVAELHDGQIVLPMAWIKRGGELCADSRLVTITAVSDCTIVLMVHLFILLQMGWELGNEIISVPATSFTHTYHEVVSPLRGPIPWQGEFCDVWALSVRDQF